MADRISFDDEEAILDAIDRWHVGDEEGTPLHEYLGWTWEEYSQWVGRRD